MPLQQNVRAEDESVLNSLPYFEEKTEDAFIQEILADYDMGENHVKDADIDEISAEPSIDSSDVTSDVTISVLSSLFHVQLRAAPATKSKAETSQFVQWRIESWNGGLRKFLLFA